MSDEKYPKLDIPTQTIGVDMKREGNTEYKYVYIVSFNGVKTYRAEIPKLKPKCFEEAKDAAKYVDLKLAQMGKFPVNGTLKKKD